MKTKYKILLIVAILAIISVINIESVEEGSLITREPSLTRKIASIPDAEPLDAGLKINDQQPVVEKGTPTSKLKKEDFLLRLQLAFTEAQVDRAAIDRDMIRAEGQKNPLLFTQAMRIFLNELPLDQVEHRKLAASFLADVLGDAKEKFDTDKNYETAVYAEVYQISDDLLAQKELVETDMSYEDYALLSPLEKTQLNLVEKYGQIYKSTLGSKIMGVSLAKLDGDQKRSDQYLDNLSSKIKDSDPQSQEVLVSIKNMNFKERPL